MTAATLVVAPVLRADVRARSVRVRFPAAQERAYLRYMLDRLAAVRARTFGQLGVRADVSGARIVTSGIGLPQPDAAEIARIGGLVDARVLADLERLLGTDLWWTRTGGRTAALAWAQANVGWIRSIDARYLSEVAEAVVENATDPERLAAVLEERYGVARSRAALIARDQIGTLHSTLSDRHAAAAGLSEYVWRTRRDSAVRPTHREHEGKRYRRGELAEEPGQAIGCRCVREWVVRMVPVPGRRVVPGGRIRL